MNFFEQELRKITKKQPALSDAKFMGTVCYVTLTDSTRMRLEFVTKDIRSHYEAIRATVLNKQDGKIDVLTLSFIDIWGKKQVNNPNFKDGVNPHAWANDGKTDWYVYKPTPHDYEVLSAQLENYAELFMEQEQTQGMQMKQ